MAIIRVCEPLSRKSLWVAVLSELIGTFLLVALGVGIIYINFSHAEQNAVAHSTRIILTAAGFGLVVGGIVFVLGFGFPHGSAHLNPAFTLGALVLDKVSVVRALLFIGAQIIGAIGGAAVLYGCITTMRQPAFACTTLSSGVDALQGFGIEVLGTFTLVFGALAVVAVSERHNYGAVVVATGVATIVAIIVIIAAPYTGASLNPARSVGPALVFGGKCWASHWIYWAGPLTGGLLAGAIVRILLFTEDHLPTHHNAGDVELHESRKLVQAPATNA